jgi:glycosyltransferase involved in cell wall biosynthesis
MTASVSVLIPTYNRSLMLKECVESVLAQSRPPQQILIVDDGSTDNTAEVARSFGNRVTLLSKPNGGKASALNLGLAQCAGDTVWICDDDDIAAKDGLKYLAEALESDPALGFVFGRFEIFEDTPEERRFFPPTYWPRGEETNPKINFLEEMFTFQYAMLVRRSLYQSAGPFREDLVRSQDYEMALRLARNAKSSYVPHVIFFQRRHKGARGSAADPFSTQASVEKWLAYDQKIFSGLRRDWALEEFTPSFALNGSKESAMRAALVERACVFAKRALWDEAIDDLRQAAAQAAQAPTGNEIQIAEAVIRSILPWRSLTANKAWIGRLKTVYDMNAFGRDIVLALCRPLIWQARSLLRNGDARGAWDLLELLHRIAGTRGLTRRFLLTMVRRR